MMSLLKKFPKIHYLFLGLVLTLSVVMGWKAFAATTPWLYPVADGTNHAWYGTSATNTHYNLVNEVGCDSSNYIYATTTGVYDSFYINLSALATSTITQINLIPCAASYQASGTDSILHTFYRFNGVLSNNVSYTLSPSTAFSYLATSTWSGLSHSLNASSTLEIGVRHRAGTRGSKVSNLKVKLTY